MNILIIGNGFDLEHELPTKYTDFLGFVKRFQIAYDNAKAVPSGLCNIKEEYFKRIFTLEEFEDRANALHAYVKDNMWIDYFHKVYKRHLANTENWIDFEREISSVVKAMDELIKYYAKVQMGQEKNENIANYYKLRLRDFVEVYALNEDTINSNVPQMLHDLNRLISALEIYIWDYVGNQRIKYYNPDIEKIHPDKVFSFNYSDTYRRLYAYNKNGVEYSFAHGFATNNIQGLSVLKDASGELKNIYVRMSLEKNNMVLGIDEYLEGESKNKEIDFKTQMRNQLLCNKPFKFQKKKTEQYNKKLEKLEDEIIQCYKNIEVELKEISRLQNSISHKDNQKINNEIKKNSKISFYDLLTLIKDKKHPNKIILEMCDKKETYIFDGEANYVLENEKSKNEVFEYYLCDSISDFSKLNKNITIIQ